MLTIRQKQIIALAAEGKSNDEIARELGIGRQTVMTHMVKILERLDATNRTHAVAISIRKQIIS